MISPLDYFLREFTLWARSRSDVQAVALVGSYARGAARPDSDIDLVLLVDQPQVFLGDTRWIRRFGTAAREKTEDYGKVISLRVWYTDGREVEYGFTTPDWSSAPLDEGARQVIQNGLKVLYERDNLLSRWIPKAG